MRPAFATRHWLFALTLARPLLEGIDDHRHSRGLCTLQIRDWFYRSERSALWKMDRRPSPPGLSRGDASLQSRQGLPRRDAGHIRRHVPADRRAFSGHGWAWCRRSISPAIFWRRRPSGSWVESRSEAVKVTKNLLFAQGAATTDGAPVLRANGIFQDRIGIDRRAGFLLAGALRLQDRGSSMTDPFEGLQKDFFAFFRELKTNNNRVWFEDNKQHAMVGAGADERVYSRDGAQAQEISKHCVADPAGPMAARCSASTRRRFSRNSSTSREHAACHFVMHL